MEFSKTIHLSEWSEALEKKLLAFWEERGVVFTSRQGELLAGKRGSFWGNLTSYDMSKLMTRVVITRTRSTEIVCTLHVNTDMQSITEWNRAYWLLELETLQSWLLHGDKREDEWRRFDVESREAAVRWTLSFGVLGRKMPPQVHSEHNER